ncbi:hypothetical protein CEUSTIGMA_g5557.t1 [Chlamydomonas eustigma]|uniref:Uncharacterized protein n=1 Tax=Chlamydomonas eustigma TaxID=1157962 RepID=A0A250X4V8_9CHLO|nr:hypothetical protein CEUSTIGMA_g5557.t1 [Chlamydomonas eustigma]|eukprot:GAX78115.1 hypothetical protein CEUSTIGMA_g5557.t1 [Chlamydomonas eustigma]
MVANVLDMDANYLLTTTDDEVMRNQNQAMGDTSTTASNNDVATNKRSSCNRLNTSSAVAAVSKGDTGYCQCGSIEDGMLLPHNACHRNMVLGDGMLSHNAPGTKGSATEASAGNDQLTNSEDTAAPQTESEWLAFLLGSELDDWGLPCKDDIDVFKSVLKTAPRHDAAASVERDTQRSYSGFSEGWDVDMITGCPPLPDAPRQDPLPPDAPRQDPLPPVVPRQDPPLHLPSTSRTWISRPVDTSATAANTDTETETETAICDHALMLSTATLLGRRGGVSLIPLNGNVDTRRCDVEACYIGGYEGPPYNVESYGLDGNLCSLHQHGQGEPVILERVDVSRSNPAAPRGISRSNPVAPQGISRRNPVAPRGISTDHYVLQQHSAPFSTCEHSTVGYKSPQGAALTEVAGLSCDRGSSSSRCIKTDSVLCTSHRQPSPYLSDQVRYMKCGLRT